ncbi:unnamed protein product [Brassica oleracea]|uniref:(rape) hypothetical protein n=1 Tax=Brassica napus TaxID=3708 RepID=A0A816UUF6_BRANA|nr:unnamed protein product [Brassica napus]
MSPHHRAKLEKIYPKDRTGDGDLVLGGHKSEKQSMKQIYNRSIAQVVELGRTEPRARGLKLKSQHHTLYKLASA